MVIYRHFDPNFGSTTFNFRQLTPGILSLRSVITLYYSVVLTIPYFSKLEDETYSIDSLYGNGPIKLSIYKMISLRNFDP